eukprot:scaffold64380_cov60-Phaeocystis_antarctica.AAC.8
MHAVAESMLKTATHNAGDNQRGDGRKRNWLSQNRNKRRRVPLSFWPTAVRGRGAQLIAAAGGGLSWLVELLTGRLLVPAVY